MVDSAMTRSVTEKNEEHNHTVVNFGHRSPENTFAFDTYTIYVLVAKRGLCERRHGVVMSGVIVDDESFANGDILWHVDRAGGRTPIASNISPYVHPFDNVGMRY
jgi:hypothetical protein